MCQINSSKIYYLSAQTIDDTLMDATFTSLCTGVSRIVLSPQITLFFTHTIYDDLYHYNYTSTKFDDAT